MPQGPLNRPRGLFPTACLSPDLGSRSGPPIPFRPTTASSFGHTYPSGVCSQGGASFCLRPSSSRLFGAGLRGPRIINCSAYRRDEAELRLEDVRVGRGSLVGELHQGSLRAVRLSGTHLHSARAVAMAAGPLRSRSTTPHSSRLSARRVAECQASPSRWPRAPWNCTARNLNGPQRRKPCSDQARRPVKNSPWPRLPVQVAFKGGANRAMQTHGAMGFTTSLALHMRSFRCASSNVADAPRDPEPLERCSAC